jgi:energy-coupling factor transporter ATP-binding protein EcfA2
MCKLWQLDGTVEPYEDAKQFRLTVEQLAGIHEFARLLQRLELEPRACIIRGRYVGPERAAQAVEQPTMAGCVLRRGNFFEDQLLHTLLFDIENTTTRIDPRTDPEDAIREWIAANLPVEFYTASYAWQLSNSFGHPSKSGLRVHLWFWLAEARTSAAIKAWAVANSLPVDTSLFNPVQPHYTAAPVFEPGVADPVKNRSGVFRGLEDAVEINIPEVPAGTRRTRAERLKSASAGDPIAQRLSERSMVKSTRADGGLNIDCPLANRHTGESGETSTIYYAPNTGGFVRGAFKCMHAHCADAKRADFLAALGFEAAPDPAQCDIQSPGTNGTQLTNDRSSKNGDAVQLIRGTALEPKPISWLWEGWLARGKLHVLAGAPGCGKTTVALAFAAALTAGKDWPDGIPAPRGNVLIWSGEDDFSDTLLPRLLAMGADRSRIYFVGKVSTADGHQRPFDPSIDMDSLYDAAKKIGDISLLIVDPIVNAVRGDSHKNTETRRSLQPLVDLATQLDVAVLGISHYTKGTEGRDPVERVTGSLAFGALPRIIMGAAKVSSEAGSADRILVRAKSNIGPDGGGYRYHLKLEPLHERPGVISSGVVWGEPLEGAAYMLLADAETRAAPSKAERAFQIIPQLIAQHGGQMAARELMDALSAHGIGRDCARKAINALRLERLKSGARGEWMYKSAPELGFDNFPDISDSADTKAETQPSDAQSKILTALAARPAAKAAHSIEAPARKPCLTPKATSLRTSIRDRTHTRPQLCEVDPTSADLVGILTEPADSAPERTNCEINLQRADTQKHT